jgi:hypothetical protein
VGVPWVSAVVIFSAVAGIPASAVVLTDVYVPGVSANVAVPTALMSLLLLVFPMFLAFLLLLVVPAMVNILFVNSVSTSAGVHAVGSPALSRKVSDFPVPSRDVTTTEEGIDRRCSLHPGWGRENR